MKKLFLFLLLMGYTLAGTAQKTVSGTVTDSEGKTLPGVNILVKGTTEGAVSDVDGKYKIKVPQDDAVLIFKFMGLQTVEQSVAGKTQFDVTMNSSSVGLDDVLIVGKGVVDVAKDRETPVAVSTIKIDEIQSKAGNQEFPEIMKNTPSVYVGNQAGGYGDSRINIRGFSQENIALLFNGQPINGMEDGKVYWSNWQGLSEIANAIQIQRGLGSSKLAISSVGATINVITKATDKRQGGRVSALVGDNGYMKYVGSYSTGMNEKGWGLSLLLSHWQGNGYNEGTKGKGQTYFVSVGYKPSTKHSFNLSITGAPQWHHQNFQKKISDYQKYGWKYNSNWGLKDGEEFSWRKNFYHKPVINLNWDWTPTDQSTLSTVVYASTGQGGGTGPYGSSRDAYVYGDDGQIDFDKIVSKNSSIERDANGHIVGKYGTAAIRRASMNTHSWYGMVSNFNHEINENVNFSLGADLRTYFGRHFRLVDNLLGIDGYWDNNYNGTGFKQLFEGGQLYTREHNSSPYFLLSHRNTHFDDKLDYFNTERISYVGGFGQIEYKNDVVSTFFQGAVSNQSYQRFDHHSYALPSQQDSKLLHHIGFNLKAGVNYNINENHNAFANLGYYSRQPFFDDLFLNYVNDINEDVGNEKVLGFELGYGYRSLMLDIDLNGYSTTWSDRQIRQIVDLSSTLKGVAYYENVKEVHNGVELEFKIKPTTNFKIGGFASIGIWEYKDNINATVYDENRNKVGESKLFLDGVKVGNSAQTTFGLLADYEITKGLSIDADWRYYANLYADISPSSFVKEDHKGAVKLPAYNLLDAGISYKIFLKNYRSLRFRANVNNILNTRHISGSRTNIHPEDGVDNWNGVNVNNRVYFGRGTTWNISVAYKF